MFRIALNCWVLEIMYIAINVSHAFARPPEEQQMAAVETLVEGMLTFGLDSRRASGIRRN